jgi:hypothetical protein
MLKKRVLLMILAIAGAALLYVGGFVINTESLKTFSGLSIGLGAAAFGLGIGGFIRSIFVSALEEEQFKRQKDIEVNDERNVKIKEKSGYMVSRLMNYIISALVIILSFMDVGRLAVLVLVSLLVAEFVLFIWFSNYYAKRM